MIKLLLFGAGGHAKTVIDTVEKTGTYQIVGILDDDSSKVGQKILGYCVLGGREKLTGSGFQGVRMVFTAVGHNMDRSQLSEYLTNLGYEQPALIHPSAELLRGCSVGKGTVVFPKAVVGADVEVGAGVIVSIGCVLGHDCRVGDFGQIAPNVTINGGAEVGKYALIGSGSVILAGVQVGDHVIVGANSMLNRDLPAGVTAVGSPAKIIRRNQYGT